MAVHRSEVNAFGVAAYPANPQVTVPFPPNKITVRNDDSTDDVFVSLDGVNDHVHILGGGLPHTFDQGCSKVWVRRGAAGTDPTNVQIIAED